jgi:protein farnesyltransferase subunit beta
MSIDGEIDVRGSYCVLSVFSFELNANVASFISSCQSPWDGFSAQPGREAHGGYTFCALATLVMLDSVELIDLDTLVVNNR